MPASVRARIKLGMAGLSASAALLAFGPPAGGAQSGPYPTTAAYTASDAPDLWNAAGGGNAVAIALGGTVSFAASTVEAHDASFDSDAVACVSGGQPTGSRVPATPSAAWNGACTFSAPGYHAFVCTVHVGMDGEVAVAGADGVLAPRTPVSPPPAGGTTPGGGESGGVGTPGGGAPLATAPALQPVFDIDREQRGHVVRGTIAGAGPAATVTLEIGARRRDLEARGRPAGSVRLRRLTRTTGAAGSTTFTIALSRAVRRAVVRRKRLTVTVRVGVRGPRIAAGGVTRTLRVTLLAPGVPATALARATVEVRNDFFAPRTVTIRRGATVTWAWRSDGRRHNVVASGARSPDQTDGSYRRTFRSADSFRYACSLHDGMIGTVNVR